MNQTLFDQSWLSEAESKCTNDTWVYNVIKNINESGKEYLSILQKWFQSHPFPSKGKKKHLQNALESLNNQDHLGAVNELFWYRFMCDLSLKPKVLPEGKSKTPDFKGTSASGIEFYCEVTTLNISSKNANNRDRGEGTPLNSDEEISRIIRIATEEKDEQLRFGIKEQKPMVFVVFDYSTFSGFGTQFPIALINALLKTAKGLQAMQPHLSAIVYVERFFGSGLCRIRISQSAACHNPLADFPLPFSIFKCFRQYYLDSYKLMEPILIDIVVS